MREFIFICDDEGVVITVVYIVQNNLLLCRTVQYIKPTSDDCYIKFS